MPVSHQSASLNDFLSIRLRVAVVQLRCHQAAQVGNRDYLCEPFVGAALPISQLISNGLRQFESLRAEIKRDYLQWHNCRIKACLDYIERVDSNRPVSGGTGLYRRILLVVFPEFSIPFELLSTVHDWVKSTANSDREVIVFAGTHCLPHRTAENMHTYSDTFKISANEISSAYDAPLPTRSVLPIFYTSTDNRGQQTIQTRLKLKRILSPFELTNMDSHIWEASDLFDKDLVRMPLSLTQEDRKKRGRSQIQTVPHDHRKHSSPSLTFLPAICSEALQIPSAGEGKYDIAVIPAYHDKTDYFEHVKQQWSRNQHLVLLANDGKFGGSGFWIPPSIRGESWWLGHPNNGSLPKGDALVMADLRPLDLAEQSQVFNPSERCELIRLSSIVPDNQKIGEYGISLSLEALRESESSDSFEARQNSGPKMRRQASINLVSRKKVLTDCLSFGSPNELQTIKLNRLLHLREINPRVWQFHTDDVIYRSLTSVGQGRTEGFSELEALLTKKAIKRMREVQSANELYERQSKELNEAISACQNMLKSSKPGSSLYTGDPINNGAERRLDLLLQRGKSDANHRIAQRIAELVEQFRATSAWVISYTPFIEFPLVPSTRSVNSQRIPGWTHARREGKGRNVASKKGEINLQPLSCVASHNASPPRHVTLSNSLAGLCIRQRRIIVYPYLQQRHSTAEHAAFLIEKESSASAVGVPVLASGIIGPRGRESVIGAIVLESNLPYTFSLADGYSLFNASRDIAADLHYLSRIEGSFAPKLLWRPPSVSWSSAEPMHSVANEISEAVAKVSPKEPRIGVTVWHSDPEQGEAFALGAVGFDSDYVSQNILETVDRFSITALVLRSMLEKLDSKEWKTLPKAQVKKLEVLRRSPEHDFIDMTEEFRAHVIAASKISLEKTTLPIEIVALLTELLSRSREGNGGQFIKGFVGKMLTSAPDTFLSKHWRHIPEFQRQVKAERMELSHVVASNYGICVHENVFDPSHENKQKGFDQFRLLNDGVVCFHAYGGSFNALSPYVAKPQVQEFARRVTKLLRENLPMFIRYTSIVLEARLRQRGVTQECRLQVFRELLVEVFRAQGCSIFAGAGTVCELPGTRITKFNMLRCVSSTGIQCEGQESVATGVKYIDLRIDSPHATVRSFLTGKAICVNRERGVARSDTPVDRFRESASMTEKEHRRLLIVPILNKNQRLVADEIPAIGVVRIVRSEMHQPFSHLDRTLLSVLCGVFAEVFLEDQVIARCLRDQQREPHAIPGATRHINELEGKQKIISSRKRLFRDALFRILTPTASISEWGRRHIEIVLEDLFCCFDSYKPVLSMLRTVSGGEPRHLLATAWHSYASHQIGDAASRGFSERDGGLGWLCASTRTILEVSRDAPLFRESFPDCHHKTQKAVLVPIVLPFRDEPVFGVVSIEFASAECPIDKDVLGILLAGAWRLSLIARDQECIPSWLLTKEDSPGIEQIGNSFQRWMHNGRRGSSKTWKLIEGFDTPDLPQGRIDTADYISLIRQFGNDLKNHDFGRFLRGWDWSLVDGESLDDSLAADALPSISQGTRLNCSSITAVSDPLWQVALVANGGIVPSNPPKHGDVSEFEISRIPSRLLQRAEAIRHLGGLVDLVGGAIRMPLWIGSAVGGMLVGRRKEPNSLDGQKGLMLAFDVLVELQWQWAKFVGDGIRLDEAGRGMGIRCSPCKIHAWEGSAEVLKGRIARGNADLTWIDLQE